MVLDDYHLVDAPPLQPAMTFLLEHLPPQVHLVISTRVDPALPLARLRARGELLEVRAVDLRFSLDEVSAYLNRNLGLDLTDADIAALESRTEGWIAALQLAALSLEGREDPAAFIASFAGDDRFIVDYLIEEVLDRQPPDVREFLLQTSVLDRLSAALCDAVISGSRSKQMLESLVRSNLFLVALDDTRGWYRYHHLFADLLRAHLHDEHPGLVSELHRRAAAWFDAADEPLPAVRHALAAGDPELAADLVELAIPTLRRNRQEATISGWVDLMPDRLVQERPVLALGLISGLMAAGRFDGIEERIDAAEGRLRRSSEDEALSVPIEETVVVDRSEWTRLAGALAMYRAAAMLVHGDTETTVELAERAMTRAADDDHLTKAGAAAIAGLARWGRGDLEAAHRAYTTCVEGLLRSGHVPDVLGCSLTLADIRITQGRLSEARQTYEDALALAEGETGPVRGTADMYVGLSQIAWLRNDLPSAAHYLELSDELGDQAGLPQHPYRSRAAHACLRQAAGDLPGATDLLVDAERVYFTDFLPDVRSVTAMTTRLRLAQGDVAAARAWVRDRQLSVDDDLDYLHEYEHITLARVLLGVPGERPSDAALKEATRLLRRLLSTAEAGDRVGNVIEILVLQAQALHLGGETARSREVLHRALAMAEPEGHLRVFLDEGPALITVLHTLEREKPAQGRVRTVLDAVDQQHASDPDAGEGGARGTAERARARRAPAAGDRSGRSRHRARAQRLVEHRPDAHPARLHQARGEQPPCRRARRRPARTAAPPLARLNRPRPRRQEPSPGSSPVMTRGHHIGS